MTTPLGEVKALGFLLGRGWGTVEAAAAGELSGLAWRVRGTEAESGRLEVEFWAAGAAGRQAAEAPSRTSSLWALPACLGRVSKSNCATEQVSF